MCSWSCLSRNAFHSAVNAVHCGGNHSTKEGAMDPEESKDERIERAKSKAAAESAKKAASIYSPSRPSAVHTGGRR